MTESQKTASEILLEAANLLIQEKNETLAHIEWNKGAYFEFYDKGCHMCAHGAIQYCGRPSVKAIIDSGVAAAARGAVAAASGAAAAARSAAGGISIEDYVRIYYNGEVGLAHYRAAKVGLTFEFNDDPKTTKADVIEKLREAAKL